VTSSTSRDGWNGRIVRGGRAIGGIVWTAAVAGSVLLSSIVLSSGTGIGMIANVAHAADERPAANGAAANAKDFDESWQVIYIGKARIGHNVTTTETVQRNGRPVVITHSEAAMAIQRFGQSVKTRTIVRTEETEAGDLLNFTFELQNPPAATTRTTGVVKGDKVEITTDVGGKISRSEAAWDATVKAPTYQSRVLKDRPLKPGEKRTLRIFDPQFNKVNTLQLAAGDFVPVTLLDGKEYKLLKVSVSQSLVPGLAMEEYLDAQGDTYKSTMSLLNMATYKVSRKEALREVGGAELDLAVSTLVKTNPLERPLETKKVVYRVTMPGEDPVKILASGPTQEVQRIGPHVADVTVSAITAPAQAPPKVTPPAAIYTQPNRFLQSDDARVQAHAKAATQGEQDPWKASQKMERWVQANVKQKNFSTLLASAAEVAQNLSGDCTEHATLLAAMARSQGIPARVAVGLVYIGSEAALGGHMWTEVFVNGTWVPLDGTLGRGGVGASHLKFADSNLDEDGPVPVSSFVTLMAVLGKMKVEIVSAEH